MRGALKFDILYASFLADAALIVASAFRIDYENVRLHYIQSRNVVDDSASGVDVGVLHIFDALDHEEALLLREHRLAVLVFEVGLVRSYSHIEVTVSGGLDEEFYVAAVQQVVAAADKYFLVRHRRVCWSSPRRRQRG